VAAIRLKPVASSSTSQAIRRSASSSMQRSLASAVSLPTTTLHVRSAPRRCSPLMSRRMACPARMRRGIPDCVPGLADRAITTLALSIVTPSSARPWRDVRWQRFRPPDRLRNPTPTRRTGQPHAADSDEPTQRVAGEAHRTQRIGLRASPPRGWGPIRRISSSPWTPQHTCARTRNVGPPNVHRSATSWRPASSARTRSASCSSKARSVNACCICSATGRSQNCSPARAVANERPRHLVNARPDPRG
jgi:hypothetical protein